MPQKELVIVGGPNGAGKTTFAMEYAPLRGWGYLGADAIAAELAPSDPASQQFAAGRRFLELIAEVIAGEESFVVESTLSGRTFCHWIERAREAGFKITLMYLFLDSPDTCVARVNERVQAGGHFVPEADIRRRYQRSAMNFWRQYRRLADDWILVYNMGSQTQDVAVGTSTEYVIRDAELFATFLSIVKAHDG